MSASSIPSRDKGEPIAIIGMGCRFPGPQGTDVTTPEAFWELLCSGEDIIRDVPASRWKIDDYYDPNPNAPGKMYVRKGYYLEAVDQFDPQFFNLAPREAASLDPQQRLVLEVSWETLEHAGVAPAKIRGSQTGVFVSTFWDDYSSTRLYNKAPQTIDRYATLSNLRSMVAGRLSHLLGVHGPTIQVDTACSASLTAIHLACQSLRNGECDLALAGGSYLLLTPEITIGLCRMGALAADGHSKAFAQRADGFGQGEGCGMVLLKRLSDAQAAGDTIWALIRGSAINHDGHSRTVTTPNGNAQLALLRQALQQADVAPYQVQYVETHGTGTELGDPIEVSAIAKAFCQDRSEPLAIGSVKTNIGHLNAAAGVAGLFKVVLAMHHQAIPPTLHIDQLNPRIPWQKLPITVPTVVTPWETHGTPRIAGISSFGMSGSNAHILLQEAPSAPPDDSAKESDRSPGRRPAHLLTLSAKTPEALHAQLQRYQAYLQQNNTADFADICYSANSGRQHFPHRLALIANSAQEACQQLAAAQGNFPLQSSVVEQNRAKAKVAFLFTGQGAQYVGMGRLLYETQPTFRQTLDHCDELLRPLLGESILRILYPDTEADPSSPAPIDETIYTQPALFVLEYALATLWQSWGIKPDLLLGHSIGELVAACLAGVFTLEDGLKLVAARGRLMHSLPPIGAMVSLATSAARAETAIAPYASEVSLAAINGPQSVVIAGKRETVQTIADQLAAEGIKTHWLAVSHAFHSPLMEPILAEFRSVAESITYARPTSSLISNVNGELATDEIATAEYWVRHIRQTVRFADGVQALSKQGVGICLEMGPKPVLLGMLESIHQQSQGVARPPLLYPTLRQKQNDWQQMLTTVAALYRQGVEIDWESFDRDEPRRRVVLPTYPFQRQQCWIEAGTPVRETEYAPIRSTDLLATNGLVTDELAAFLQPLVEQANLQPNQRTRITELLAKLNSANHSQPLAAQVEHLLYTVVWERAAKLLPPTPYPTQKQPPGRWVILSDAGGVGHALAAQLHEVGEQVVTLPSPTLTSSLPDLQDLASYLAPGAEAVRGIIYLWGLNTTLSGQALPLTSSESADKTLLHDVDSLLQSQLYNCGNLLHLVQLLAAHPTQTTKLWVVTQSAQPVTVDTSANEINFTQTSLWGLGRVIAVEHPERWGGLIDLDPTLPPSQTARQLAAELLKAPTDSEDQVAYRNSNRYLARLARSKIVQPAQKSSQIRSDATYLITGGLGALGLTVAQWLVDQGAQALILISRRGVTSEAQAAALRTLSAGGVQVQLVQADVADAAAMQQLFAQIAAGTRPLKGIFHTAGVLDDGILLNQSWQRFANVMRAKVTGSWLLHQLAKDLDLDLMIFFSSLASLIGSPGQGNYAAANAFLDGLAHYRQQRGQVGLSINWGAWATANGLSGMAGRTPPAQAAFSQSLTPELGGMALKQLLSHSGQIGVAAIDWSQFASNQSTPFLSQWVTPPATVASKTTLRQEFEALPVSQRSEHLAKYLQQATQRILGLTDLPERTIGFTEMGMDSLMALELKRQIERSLQLSLSATVAFEYPTITALAHYLWQEQLAPDQAPEVTNSLASTRPFPATSSISEAIAVIGMGCRFPGADSPAAFWQLLCNGSDQVCEVPSSRWAVDDYYDPQRPMPGKMYTRQAAFLDQVDQFDPGFFGISPREAISMDPQHRLLLEVSWEALEDAGIAPASLIDSQTGVFVGIGSGDYGGVNHTPDLTSLDAYVATGNGHSIAAGRLAYTLGLQGPTLAVDTACSSSLVALHLACQSLRNGECNLALAGGVHLLLSPNGHIALSQLQALAPDGRCKTFAASADGYGRGEGCGVVVLKPLSAAQAAGDPILAVIKGSAVNHDGPSSGLTVPNKRAQEKLLRQALHNAQLTPDTVAYIEAHGTGTPLGDPLELRALNAVYGVNRTTPLLVSSVKTNIGHLEAAAGIAGLIKTVMALHHEQIPPHLHFTAPNPYIEWDELAVTVPTTLQPWPAPAGNQERVAGVSSFGLSGTNAHVIVASAPALPQSIDQPTADTSLSTPSSALFPLSAKSSAALSALATRYAQFLADEPQLDLVDLCHTAATGRNHFRHRLAIIANSTVDLQSRLSQVAAQGLFAANAPNALYTSAEQTEQASPRLAFLFTGQGAQYVNMGHQLYTSAPVFRQALDRCAEILQPLLPAPDGASSASALLSVLYPASTSTQINDTAYTQPVLFALEYALTQLWHSWGLEPEIVLGHSVGEYVAACVAGVFSLEDALRLVAARGRLMSALPADGAMLAVLTSEARVQNALEDYAQRTGRPNDVALAAINAPNNVVISGQRQAVQMIADTLASEGVTSRRLTVSHAFHSPLMTPMLDEFRQVAATITYHAPTLPLVSNLTGQLAGAEIATPDYWVRHISAPVRFAASIQTVQAQGLSHWLEIGPKPTLLNLAQQCLDQMTIGQTGKEGERHPVLLASLHPIQSDWQQLLASLATLYTAGAAINWSALTPGQHPHRLVLPTYPFQRQRYWQATSKPTPLAPALRPLIDRQINVPLHKQTLFEKDFSLQSLPFLADHHVYGAIVTPGACHLALALSVAELLLGGAPCQLDDVIFPQALMLGTDDQRTVQCSVDAAKDASGAAFRIISFANTEHSEPPTHATGRITPLTQPAPVISLPDLQLRCQQPLLPADLYEAIQASQVTLGPTFRWFVALWRGEGDEALAHLQLPDALSDVQGYPLFPSLIDACFQVVGAATLGQLDQTQTTRLPFALTALTRYQPSDQRDLWCHASSTDGQHWTIVLLTADGTVIAQISGFQMRPVPPAAIYGNRLRTDWLYTQTWQESPLLRASAPTAQPACWLIMGGTTGISASLTARLHATGAAIVLATSGSRYELTWAAEAGLTAQAVLDPLAPEMFHALLTALAARYQTVGVVCLWSYDPLSLATEPATTPDQLTLRLTSGLLHLTQALIATHVPATLTVVTNAAQVYQLAEPDTHHPNQFDQEKLAWLAATGTLWGLGRTIALEHPQLSCTCLDLQNDSADLDSAALFGELVQKAFPQGAVSAQKLGTPSPTGETQILYHQQVRYVARIASWQPTAPTAQHAISIGADGCYLITGGLGGLGWQVAEQLVAEGARQLVLSSRRPVVTSALEQQIVRWQSEGVQIHVIAADISDATDVERLLAACQTIAPLRGIVHAAGVLDDALLVDQSSARLATVMQAKVMGTWQLHCQTLHLPLDFFICFSSAASWLGSAGQGNYAAANAFMDTLMQQRRLLGLCGTTINWSGWAEVGMAARQANQRAMLAQPFQPLALTQARQLFGYLLKQNALQVGVCDLNQTVLRGHTAWAHLFQPVLGLVTDASDFAPATPSLYSELAPLPARQRYDQLFHYLHGQVARILRLPTAEQIAARQPLFELGLDSLMALELKNQLQAALPVTLHATLLFDYPTLAQLTGYLCEQLWEQVPDTNGIDIALATDAPVDQESSNLSELSGYELLDLLKQLKETA